MVYSGVVQPVTLELNVGAVQQTICVDITCVIMHRIIQGLNIDVLPPLLEDLKVDSLSLSLDFFANKDTLTFGAIVFATLDANIVSARQVGVT